MFSTEFDECKSEGLLILEVVERSDHLLHLPVLTEVLLEVLLADFISRGKLSNINLGDVALPSAGHGAAGDGLHRGAGSHQVGSGGAGGRCLRPLCSLRVCRLGQARLQGNSRGWSWLAAGLAGGLRVAGLVTELVNLRTKYYHQPADNLLYCCFAVTLYLGHGN